MSQDLTYHAGDATYAHRASRSDWQLITFLREHLPDEIGALFDVPALGESVRVAADTLAAAADAVLALVADRRDLLPYTYQFKEEVAADPGARPGFGTGGVSGIRLPGDDGYYSIRAGLNECRLRRIAIGPDGRGYTVDERDLRGERELLTANMGRIVIRRTRAKTDLVRALGEMARFFRTVGSAEVAKRVG